MQNNNEETRLWSEDEMVFLIAASKEYKNRWKVIIDMHSDIFKENHRSEEKLRKKFAEIE